MPDCYFTVGYFYVEFDSLAVVGVVVYVRACVGVHKCTACARAINGNFVRDLE